MGSLACAASAAAGAALAAIALRQRSSTRAAAVRLEADTSRVRDLLRPLGQGPGPGPDGPLPVARLAAAVQRHAEQRQDGRSPWPSRAWRAELAEASASADADAQHAQDSVRWACYPSVVARWYASSDPWARLRPLGSHPWPRLQRRPV